VPGRLNTLVLLAGFSEAAPAGFTEAAPAGFTEAAPASGFTVAADLMRVGEAFRLIEGDLFGTLFSV